MKAENSRLDNACLQATLAVWGSSKPDHFGQWIQHDDYIQNETIGDATAEDMISRRAAETYTSMVLKQKFNPNMTVQATMAFAR